MFWGPSGLFFFHFKWLSETHLLLLRPKFVNLLYSCKCVLLRVWNLNMTMMCRYYESQHDYDVQVLWISTWLWCAGTMNLNMTMMCRYYESQHDYNMQVLWISTWLWCAGTMNLNMTITCRYYESQHDYDVQVLW